MPEDDKVAHLPNREANGAADPPALTGRRLSRYTDPHLRRLY